MNCYMTLTKKQFILPIFSFVILFVLPLLVQPVYAQRPWEKCCEGNTAGCRTYDPNTGWKGVCSTFQLNECYSGGNPWAQSWGACSASCGGGTQTCTQSNGCGLTSSCGTRSCNTQACTPTATIVPTSAVTVAPSVTPGGPTITTSPNNPTSSCAKKSQGDANCDGVINETDFNFWKQEFDTMQPAAPPNQNANFACVEGNTQTYFVDLSDFEVWRRNTASGLMSSPPQPGGPTITPGGPSATPDPNQPTSAPPLPDYWPCYRNGCPLGWPYEECNTYNGFCEKVPNEPPGEQPGDN